MTPRGDTKFPNVNSLNKSGEGRDAPARYRMPVVLARQVGQRCSAFPSGRVLGHWSAPVPSRGEEILGGHAFGVPPRAP